MLAQRELTEGHVVALWLGDFESFEDLDAYICGQFESDFGFRLNDRAMPEISEPCGVAVPIKDLLAGFSFHRGWIGGAIVACEEMKIREAKAAVVFHHLRYRPELCRTVNTPIKFVANIPWLADEPG